MDAQIRSRTRADAKRGFFAIFAVFAFAITRVSSTQQEASDHIRATLDRIHISGATRDLIGTDLNEKRSKMDPLPCARSLTTSYGFIVCIQNLRKDLRESNKISCP